MLHRFGKVKPGQRVLIHGASGGVGTALLQLGRLAGLEMYGTCSSRGASAVSGLGGVPIDYQHQDLITLLDLLKRQKIKPIIARRFRLSEARQAQELLGEGGVVGKIVLVHKGSSLESELA
jgi:NADPH2:quinone reductase